MSIITYQPALRQALPNIYGPLEYREERAMYERIDHLLSVSGIKVFAKSTSDRFTRWVSEAGLRRINERLTALLGAAAPLTGLPGETPAIRFGLPAAITCDEVFFDSACLKAHSHFPVDWVLLRDASRTLMRATVLIRKAGLKTRMPQEPLEFLSDMNTLCMKMSASRRAVDGRKRRKKVLREMKALERRIAGHARAHLEALRTCREETDLTAGQAQVIIGRMEGVLEQLPAAIKQAHERIIGERKVDNKDKILSLYDDSINVIVRGKAGAEVEFGNKLWLGETKEGLIVDYKLYEDNPSDSALVKPAIQRLVVEQDLAIKHAWGDRGLASKLNKEILDSLGIRDGLCPRDVAGLAKRPVDEEPGFRAGLKRRAGTEARIGIFKNVFMGRPAPAKGFAHREQAVGWAVLTHNLWVVARLAEAECKRQARAA